VAHAKGGGVFEAEGKASARYEVVYLFLLFILP